MNKEMLKTIEHYFTEALQYPKSKRITDLLWVLEEQQHAWFALIIKDVNAIEVIYEKNVALEEPSTDLSIVSKAIGERMKKYEQKQGDLHFCWYEDGKFETDLAYDDFIERVGEKKFEFGNFITTKAHPRGGPWTSARSGVFDPGKIAVKILPHHLRGGSLFTYLFRRFGYPNQGWDDHKELARYLLTTPMDNVFLEVCPYVGDDYRHGYLEGPDEWDTRLMFGYCVSQEIEEELYRIPLWEYENTDLYQRCNNAFKDAIRDLQRPVYVRDVPINCYGRIPDKEESSFPEGAEPASEAGYGIPVAFFEDIDRYDKFIDAMVKLGGGDVGKGMEWVIDQSNGINSGTGSENP